MVSKIFNKEINPPANIQEAVLLFFDLAKNFPSSIDGKTTYPGRCRSIEDCYCFCKECLDVSIDDVAKSILELCAVKRISGIYCYEVERYVFSAYTDNFNSYKGISREDFAWPLGTESEHDENVQKYIAWFSDLTGDDYAQDWK